MDVTVEINDGIKVCSPQMHSGGGDGVETALVPCRVSPSTVVGLDLLSDGWSI